MKIVVDTPEEYKKWLAGKTSLVKSVKEEQAAKDAEKNPVIKDTTAVKVDTTLVASATTK